LILLSLLLPFILLLIFLGCFSCGFTWHNDPPGST
jgi:hypothetical protein